MTRVRLLLGLAVLVAVVFPASAVANPPIPSSTYNLCTSSPCVPGGSAFIGQLHIPANGDQQGALLDEGSFVDAPCVAGGPPLFIAHVVLDGTPINNPAGVINAFPPPDKLTKIPPPGGTVPPGTLTVRFFIRWFPSVSSAPTGQTFSLPPGDIGSGNVSGRNNPTVSGGPGFCSFNLNFSAAIPST
jgi:hypothetical protein